MRNIMGKLHFYLLAAICLSGIGCKEQIKTDTDQAVLSNDGYGVMIGSLADVFSFESIPAAGYGIVGGLNGTGSVECPPNLRKYFEKYVMKQISGKKVDMDTLINNPDTAVVAIEALMPATGWKNKTFDVKVTALIGTQTMSLNYGWLYSAELRAVGGGGLSAMATVEGPVFINMLGSETDLKTGFVLGGATAKEEYNVTLNLRESDYKTASNIRNRLNERFGGGLAKALSPSQIELTIPSKYKKSRRRFVSIVRTTYLFESSDLIKQRISHHINELVSSSDKYTHEIALEAIGKETLDGLSDLLGSSNESVRFHAARCMLNLGSDKGFETLRSIAVDTGSNLRIEALDSITSSAAHSDAVSVSRMLLEDEDIDIRLAAYEDLRQLKDLSVKRHVIAGKLVLEEISAGKGHQTIFVSRSIGPRIALLGSPIMCKENLFVQSEDGSITLNAPAGQGYVTVMRRHPKRPDVIATKRSSFELSDIIRVLCQDPVPQKRNAVAGLGVSYSDVIALLEKMAQKGAVEAQFSAGSLPKIDLKIK